MSFLGRGTRSLYHRLERAEMSPTWRYRGVTEILSTFGGCISAPLQSHTCIFQSRDASVPLPRAHAAYIIAQYIILWFIDKRRVFNQSLPT